jgi:hypothetical protein
MVEYIPYIQMSLSTNHQSLSRITTRDTQPNIFQKPTNIIKYSIRLANSLRVFEFVILKSAILKCAI